MKVTIYTQAYNVEKYIRKCVESVLNQTFMDFEYFLIDNGSTDSTRKILLEYASKDSRIKLVCLDNNTRDLRAKYRYDFQGEYYTLLDSDDWIENNYLEILLRVAEETNSDIINTGSVMHYEVNGTTKINKNDVRLTIDKCSFSEFFPELHWYYRQHWGMLVKTELVKKQVIPLSNELDLTYGGDTAISFLLLREPKRITINNSALHHYRIREKSVSGGYDKRQSFSDIYLYNDAINFLSVYGEINNRNFIFLHIIYFSAINDTLYNIKKSNLSPDEKLNEIIDILKRDVTKECFDLVDKQKDIVITYFGNENYILIKNIKVNCICAVLDYISTSSKKDLSDILITLLPSCAQVIKKENVGLLLHDDFIVALAEDDKIGLIRLLCDYLSENKYSKQYDMIGMLKSLVNDSMLLNITNKKFISKHAEIYVLVVQGDYSDALSLMNSTLISQKNKVDELFLWLYLTIAALLEKADEFIFGKLCSAHYHFRSKEYDKCKLDLNDLSEMGVEDNDEIIRIRRELEKVGK